MSIQYPILNIGVGKCSEELFQELFRFDDIFLDSKGLATYDKLFANKEYVDLGGRVYKAIDIIEESNLLRSILPIKKKYRIKFQATGKTLSLQEVKKEYLSCIEGFECEESRNEAVTQAKNAKSIAALFD